MALNVRNILTRLQGCVFHTLRFNSTIIKLSGESDSPEFDQPVEPIISRKKYLYEERFFVKPRELWIENLDTINSKKLGLVTLHPDIYAAAPRVDLIHKNVHWQRMYRYVSYAHTKTRAEVRGGGKKPWDQKGLGRARHGSIRSPLWRGGGIIHGPRSHTTYFYMLPFYIRVAGLTSTLSIKLAQDDLFIVNNLEIPTEDPAYVEQLIEERNWGPSVLIIDTDDFMPHNITMATDQLKHVNLMPVYGLNVFSMLKHTTLILTERAARTIEEKLLFQINRADSKKKTQKYKLNQ